MTADRNKAATPLMEPHDADKQPAEPEPVATDAPISTDDDGKPVTLPDEGGRID